MYTLGMYLYAIEFKITVVNIRIDISNTIMVYGSLYIHVIVVDINNCFIILLSPCCSAPQISDISSDFSPG